MLTCTRECGFTVFTIETNDELTLCSKPAGEML